MPRLTYLYVRHRNYRLSQLQTDGHYHLIQELVRRGIVSRARIVREGYGTTKVVRELHKPGFEVWSVPRLGDWAKLEPGEIVWVRGGWKAWLPWVEQHMKDHWFIYYGANAGHHPWKHWDVILEDTVERPPMIGSYDKLLWHYRKPVSRDFKPLDIRNTWDVCVGASHIYDRKGQYRILAVSDEYYNLTGKHLRCVMPGNFYSREKHTEAMKKKLRAGAYPYIHLPGFLPRGELMKIFSRSTFMYAATCGGQGDRCALEATACGCRLIISLPKNHAPYLYADKRYAFVPPTPADTGAIARYLAHANMKDPARPEVARYFRANGGTEAVVSSIEPLLRFLTTHRKDRLALKELV